MIYSQCKMVLVNALPKMHNPLNECTIAFSFHWMEMLTKAFVNICNNMLLLPIFLRQNCSNHLNGPIYIQDETPIKIYQKSIGASTNVFFSVSKVLWQMGTHLETTSFFVSSILQFLLFDYYSNDNPNISLGASFLTKASSP